MLERHVRIQIQDRDIEVLRAIGESPACSRLNVAAMFFNGSYEAAKKRLQQLAVAGLVRNDAPTGYGRTILCLTGEGADLVQANVKSVGCLRTESLSPRMHRHEQMLADCQFAFRHQAEREKIGSIEFLAKPEQASFTVECREHGEYEAVRPDGFCILKSGLEGETHYFFFEIDRATETQGHLVHLAKQYRAFARSRDFDVRARYIDGGKTSFRVLLIFSSTLRLKNALKKFGTEAGVQTLIWFTTHDLFTVDPFGLIWLCPVDFGNEIDKRALLEKPESASNKRPPVI